LAVPSPTRWARLKATVDAVIDAPSSQVSRLLKQVASAHDSVYAAARSMLRRRSSAEGFLDSSPSLPVTRKPRVSSLPPGTRLADRYRVEQLRGTGGMGEVYECFDEQLSEGVAVKVLRREYAEDEEFVRQFRDELALGRRIQHRNVCHLYELQSCELSHGKVVFFTMELLDGETLDERLQNGPMPELDAVPIAIQVLDGISAIHDAGILHRDLKCSNIMLLPNADSETVPRAVVMDFGLARRFDTAQQTLTAIAEGAFAGTPAYMPPEQLEGRALTRASDIHAFGVVLFRMVTGKFPFPGDTDLQIVMRRLNSRALSSRRYAPSLTRRLEKVIDACLDAVPASRPQTASDVADLLHGRTSISRMWPWAASILLIVSLGTAALGFRSYLRPAPPINPEVLRHYQLGQEFVDRRQGEDLQQAIAEFDKAIVIDPTYAPAHVGLAESYSALSNWGLMEPKAALAKAREAADRAVSLDRGLASAHAVLGYTVSIDVDQWRNATPHFDRALSLNADDPKVRLWYAAHLGRLGQHQQAIAQILEGLRGKPADMLLNHQLASEYFRGKEYPEFLRQAEELVRLQPFQANSHLVRARALEALKRYDEAVEACRLAEKYSLDRSQLVLMLGMIESARGRLPEAHQYAGEAEKLPRTRPVDLAALYARLGRLDAAVARLQAGYQNGDSSVLTAHVNPYFEPLARYPPFLQFLRQIRALR
jgi:serine/threonine protein kinase/Flp pilus assembly protein TadD